MTQILTSLENNKSIRMPVLYASESVTEGHPDKGCDGFSDTILDAALEQDPNSRVACETAAYKDGVLVFGEITTEAELDIDKLIRQKIARIGYTGNTTPGFDADTCEIIQRISKQSPNISNGVSFALEARQGSANSYDAQGAGDQGFMYGGACRQTEELMPAPHLLAHKVVAQLTAVRKANIGKNTIAGCLRPDGKSQVVMAYENNTPAWVKTVIVAAQHAFGIDQSDLSSFVIEEIVKKAIPANLLRPSTEFLINSSGEFYYGGPAADSGLTGRKIIVDTYGGMFRHGGGAFSGKDPSKVDRSGAYFARWIAKNLVAAGLAETLELQVSYAIGKARPLSVNIKTYGTNVVSKADIRQIIERNFDFRPEAIIERLRLRRPIYEATSAYGHFGRTDIDAPWEEIISLDM